MLGGVSVPPPIKITKTMDRITKTKILSGNPDGVQQPAVKCIISKPTRLPVRTDWHINETPKVWSQHSERCVVCSNQAGVNRHVVVNTNPDQQPHSFHHMPLQKKGSKKMTKRKLTKREREEVKEIFKSQRRAGRCRISKRLAAEANELTKDIDAQIKKLESEISTLRTERHGMLSEVNLVEFDNKSKYCSKEDLHPELIAYDEETDRLLVELLTEETIPVDVKAVLTKALGAEA